MSPEGTVETSIGEGTEIDIMNQDWDYLIILDACRYDYFEKVYRSYLSHGTLKKVRSPASNTMEWCKKVFREKHDDVIYISANPSINSKVPVGGFDPKKHFHKIVDVWDWGWDKRLGTVHPKTMNLAVMRSKERYPKRRLIIHHIQPHSPYLIFGYQRDPAANRKTTSIKTLVESVPRQIRKSVGKMSDEILGRRITWKLRGPLELPPVGPRDLAFRFGDEKLRQAYEENLKIVLSYVAQLLEKLSGKIVVTADHGELLGEEGVYGHPVGHHVRPLMEVPWFEVEK